MLSRLYHYLLILFVVSFLCGSLAAATATVDGTVTYLKRIIEEGESFQQAIEGLRIEARESSTGAVLITDYTDSNGGYSLSVNYSASFDLIAISENSGVMVGNDIDYEQLTVSGVYEIMISSAVDESGTFDLEVTDETQAQALNIFHVINGARQQMSDAGYTFASSQQLRINFPNYEWSFFIPQGFIMGVLGATWDSDGYDDGILLHEFGHTAMSAFSRDDSRGGDHYLDGHYDLRLTWSEGCANFISCWLSGKPTIYDNFLNSSAEIDISAPTDDMVGADNEMAVAYVLWQALQEDEDAVIDAIFGMGAILDSETFATMDSFHDVYSGPNLQTHYLDREMSYFEDELESYTSSNPFLVQQPGDFLQENMTFYPDDDLDYFSFKAIKGDEYVIETLNANNGALTMLKLYKNSVSGTPLATNAQREGERTDTTSMIEFNSLESATYIVEISRYHNSSMNYGLAELNIDHDDDETSGYTATAGRYGGYSFSINRTKQGFSISDSDIPSQGSSDEDDNDNSGIQELPSPYGRPDKSKTTAGGGCLLR